MVKIVFFSRIPIPSMVSLFIGSSCAKADVVSLGGLEMYNDDIYVHITVICTAFSFKCYHVESRFG